ncbi:MAG: hypothetical protein V3S41_00165 [Spirochaetia bacterium]
MQFDESGKLKFELQHTMRYGYTALMPSHITHLLFAEDCCSEAGLRVLVEPAGRPYLALGAQGPDIFYHNQRRKPSGLTYGSLMHRHGYGTTVSHMAAWAWTQGLPLESWAGAWVVGFSTHATLDRSTHPYINYFSGWVERGDPHTERFRSMHPFLERLIDVALLDSARGMHPNGLNFSKLSNCGESPPAAWLDMMTTALSAAYQVAKGDAELRDRLTSAYLDTAGYYQFTNVVDEQYLREGFGREKRGEIGARWLSIVHPLSVPDTVDVLNEGHATWTHPCNGKERYSDSFLDRYDLALGTAAAMIGEIADTWKDHSRSAEDRRRRIENAVGNWNLSDGRNTERPCSKRHAAPLPLRELQTQIRESVRNGGQGKV